MKIRNGFVSNSSSSSFIILFPDGFDPIHDSVINKNIDEYIKLNPTIWMERYYRYVELTKDKINKFLNDFLRDGADYESDTVEILSNILGEYAVKIVESGPDVKFIVLLNNEKIKMALKGKNNEN